MPELMDLDLSYLTDSEVRHIKEVLLRAKDIKASEHTQEEEVAPRRDSKYFNSDDYIRATWNDQHGDENTYVPGREIVFAALLGPAPGEIKCQGESPERVSPPSSPQRGYDDAASKAVVADLIKHVEDQVQQEPPVFSEESKPTGPDVLQEEEIVQAPVVVTVTDEKDEIVEIEDVANDEVEKTGDGADRAAGAEHDEEENKRSKVGRKESWLVKKLKKVRRKSSSGSKDAASKNVEEAKQDQGQEEETGEHEVLTPNAEGGEEIADNQENERHPSQSSNPESPVEQEKQHDNNGEIYSPKESPKHEGASNDDIVISPISHDKEEIQEEPSSPKQSETGDLSLSICFYPPESAPRTPCPKKGTRLPDKSNMDVMSRKEYVPLTGTKLPMLQGSESGAHPESDGELHITVKEAVDLKLSSGIIRNKSRTYVKCYMLPDRFHATKMRSSVCKETNSPSYHHTFVFRGFSQKEFEEHTFEILICGLSFAMGKAVIVGGVRLSGGKGAELQTSSKSDTTADDIDSESINRAFLTPGQEVSVKIPILAKIKPTYQ